MGTLEEIPHWGGEWMSVRRPSAACSMVDSMLEVLLYKQSCNVQNVDSYQILEKRNQRATNVALHLLSAALGCLNTLLSAVCYWVLTGCDCSWPLSSSSSSLL